MNNLKLLRSKKKLSQQKLAEQLNLSQQSIYKYENQLSEPDIQTLKEMARIFDTSIDYIVGNTENPRRIDFMTEAALTPKELNHIKHYRQLSLKRQELIDTIIEDYTE